MKNQYFQRIIARASAPVFQQQELPFSKEDKEQIKDASIRHQQAIIEDTPAA